jgi:hypothetical protein
MQVRLVPGFLPRVAGFFRSAPISLWRTRRAVATKVRFKVSLLHPC